MKRHSQLRQLDEISVDAQSRYFRAAERSKSAAQGSADYARKALRNPEKAAEHEKTVAKRTAGISRYTKRYNERNPRPVVKAAPAATPYKPLGGYDRDSGKSYNESVDNPYELHEISAELAKSYLDKSKTAGVKDLAQVARRFTGSLRAQGTIHRDELKKMGDRLAQQRKDLGLQKEQVVTEMDKGQTPPGRDGGKQGGKEYTAKPIATKKAVSAAERIMNRSFNTMMKGMSQTDKVKKGWAAPNTLQKEDVAEESKGLYYYVNKRKAAGISRPANHPKAPSAQDWKNAAKTAKNEDVEPITELSAEKLNKYIERATGEHGHYNMARRNTTGDVQKEFARKENKRQKGISKALDKLDNMKEGTQMKTLSQIITEAEMKVHPDAIHVKPVKVNGEQKYHVQAVGSNHAEHVKVGEHLSDSELDDFSEMGGRIKHVK